MSYLDSGERFGRQSSFVRGSDNIMDYLVEDHNFFNGIEPDNPSNPYADPSQNFTQFYEYDDEKPALRTQS